MFFLSGGDEFEEGDVDIRSQTLQALGQRSKISRPEFQHRPPLTRKIKYLSLLGPATSSASNKTGTEQLLVLEIWLQGTGPGVSLFQKPASGLVCKGDPCR